MESQPLPPWLVPEESLDRRVRSATVEIFELNRRLARANAQLREANRLQARFLEDMAHELRNPLCVILGYAGFLRESLDARVPADSLDAMDALRRNAENLQALVETLLDAARLEGGKVRLAREAFPAAEALEDAVACLRADAARKGVALSARCEDPVEVLADRVRLRQILSNLIGNAVKFTPEGGKVTVSARSEGEGVGFSVADTGRGMSKEQAARVFERFYQAEEAMVEHEGLGLGLHIVRELVALHGGRVWVDSAPGAGARFHFVIPR
ncbi:MAG TPA: HAMP domain-containing sensor histidine kinase [Elusimicrobiota bacterium]|nr:HAMP domain-containing sensor histidine kinase [Elusimicrobiota bacterium]